MLEEVVREESAGSGDSERRSTNPVTTSRSSASPICSLLIARVDWLVTSVLSPVASSRTQPSMVTSPAGGAGTSSGVAPRFSVANQPRSTSTLEPSASSSGTTTSTPAAPSRVR